MDTRELALFTTGTICGALASAFAFQFYFSCNPRTRERHCPSNSSVSGKCGSPDPYDPSKRKGYLSWDDYFMAIAFLSAERSKDPNRQVGACLVSQNRVILGIGYNGFPRGCSDDKLPWAKGPNQAIHWRQSIRNLIKRTVLFPLMDNVKAPSPTNMTKFYVCHAEVNAILNTNHASATGQKLYVTMFPCNECEKIIVQSGVSEVIYFVEKRLNSLDTVYIASHKLLQMAGIKVRKHQPQMDHILIKFEDP